MKKRECQEKRVNKFTIEVEKWVIKGKLEYSDWRILCPKYGVGCKNSSFYSAMTGLIPDIIRGTTRRFLDFIITKDKKGNVHFKFCGEAGDSEAKDGVTRVVEITDIEGRTYYIPLIMERNGREGFYPS